MSDSLKEKAVKGIGWSAIDNIAQISVTFFITIVLARLLSPEDYGLLGVTAIFTTICNSIIDGGFVSALIRKKEVTADDYNTAFISNFVISIVLYVIIYLSSPAIAYFFYRVELTSLVRVTSLGMIVGALAIVQKAQLTKKIDFKSQAKITLIASSLSGLIGIAMALLDFGVWALVAQTLSNTFLRSALFWAYNKWRPKFVFSKESFRQLFGYGWKMMLSGIINDTWNELTHVVVGKFYNPATLGQYTRSRQFSSLFSRNLTFVIQRVSFPVLSNIQDDNQRMLLAYRRIIRSSMLITTISMFLVAAISEPLVYCLIGKKWHEAAIYLPLICISRSTYPLQAINLNMLQVKGRSDLFLGLEIVKKAIALTPLVIGAFIGIIPMLYTNLITSLISFFLNSYYSGSLIGYSSWDQLKDVVPFYIVSLLVAISVYFIKFLPISFWVILPIQIVVGICMSLFICEYLELPEYEELKVTALSYLK